MSYHIIGRPVASPDGGANGVPPRLEIRELRKKPEQFALFIHALTTIMTPEHRPKAARFVDIAGIHGLPYERWSGDVEPGLESPPKGTWGGYCYHESVLFPTWHRPHLLLIEQSIGDVATRLAKDWTRNSDSETKLKWDTAAKELRFPFWDWTDITNIKDGLPEPLHPQSFTFQLPVSPRPTQIDNPLALYDFNSRHPDGFSNFIWETPLASQAISYFKDWDRTYRWPSSKKNPTEDYVKIKEKLAGSETQRGSVLLLRDQVSKLFTYPSTVEAGREATTWDEFSNTTFQSKGAGWGPHNCGSLESPHDSVHLLLGGIGVMSNNDYAAFDPIFYLHHCNIDRILAFWEYVYDQYWMFDGYKKKDDDQTIFPFKQHDGTWAEDEDQKLTQTTNLQPFRRKKDQPDQVHYWTSNDARLAKVQDLNIYTYHDINGVSLSTPLPDDPEERKRERERYIGLLRDHFSNARPQAHQALRNFVPSAASVTLPTGFELIPDYRRFVVEVTVATHAFHGSYSIQLVYNQVVIGSFAVLTRGDDTRCASCISRQKSGAQVRGIIDIPEDVAISVIKDADNASVAAGIESLKNGLSVRIVGPGDALLAVADSRDTAPLKSGTIPQLKLLSAAAATTNLVNPKVVEYGNWADHGHLLDSSTWRTI